jgi:hypothetical protein
MTNPKNEGEGNRTADKEYVDRTKQFIRSGKVEDAAKKAEIAIESPEGTKLAKAEDVGQSHAKPRRQTPGPR